MDTNQHFDTTNEENITESKTVGGFAAHPLNQVTPFSKYLAMALFIILPFVGVWIGYEMGMAKAEYNAMKATQARVFSNDNITTVSDSEDSRVAVLQETNGTITESTQTVTADSVRDSEVSMAGLDLFAYEVNNYETIATYQSVRYPRSGSTLSGDFSLGLNEMLGQYTLMFQPDNVSADMLNGENRFAVLPLGDEIVDLVFPDGCDDQCKEQINSAGFQFTGSGDVTKVEIVLDNIGVGSAGNRIEFSADSFDLNESSQI